MIVYEQDSSWFENPDSRPSRGYWIQIESWVEPNSFTQWLWNSYCEKKVTPTPCLNRLRSRSHRLVPGDPRWSRVGCNFWSIRDHRSMVGVASWIILRALSRITRNHSRYVCLTWPNLISVLAILVATNCRSSRRSGDSRTVGSNQCFF